MRHPPRSSIAVAGALMALATLVGCGEEDDTGATLPPPTLRLTRNLPASYAIHDSACQSKTAPVTLSHTTIHELSAFQLTSRRAPLTDFRTDVSFMTPHVSATIYGQRWLQRCVEWRGGECLDEEGDTVEPRTVEGSARYLRVCRDDYAYPRDTYEGVALSAVYHLERAATQLEQALPELTVPPLWVNVLPEFRRIRPRTRADGQRVEESYFITDNMGYQTPSRGAPAGMLLVFPDAAGDEQDTPQAQLWDAPFVVAHELGHHVDATTTDPLATTLGLRWSARDHRLVPTDWRVSVGRLRSQEVAAGVWGSASEAFADLMGVAADGGYPSLTSIPCLANQRDPRRALFANGEPKVLLETGMATVTGFLNAGGQDACVVPDFSDIHIVGAIHARVVAEAACSVEAWRLGTTCKALGGIGKVPPARLQWLARAWYTATKKIGETVAYDTLQSEAALAAAFQPLADGLEVAVRRAVARHRSQTDMAADALLHRVCHLARAHWPLLEPPFADVTGCTGSGATHR